MSVGLATCQAAGVSFSEVLPVSGCISQLVAALVAASCEDRAHRQLVCVPGFMFQVCLQCKIGGSFDKVMAFRGFPKISIKFF